jgi:acylphosphatase
METEIRIRVIFRGKVQGVFFRDHVKNFAQKFNVKGYVKNLRDGSVEMIAFSTHTNLEKLIRSIKEKPGNGSIDKIEISLFYCKEEFDDFKIIR